MNDLIERIEAAREDNADLFRAAATAVFGFVHDAMNRFLAAGAFTDAALTLVPEGWWLAGLHFCHPDFRSEQDKEWCAELAGPVTWSVIDREVGEEPLFEHVCASAATPALALSAAALKARAYLKETNNAD